MNLNRKNLVWLILGFLTTVEAGLSLGLFFQTISKFINLSIFPDKLPYVVLFLILALFFILSLISTARFLFNENWREGFISWIEQGRHKSLISILAFSAFTLGLIGFVKPLIEPYGIPIYQDRYVFMIPLLLFVTLAGAQTLLFYTILIHKDKRVLVFLFPFLFLLPFVLPIVNGNFVMIGNDFDYLYYRYKYYLLSGLNDNMLPLWSASEGAGFPFYSNPFSQSFYPLNIFLVVYSRLLRDYTHLDHQGFTVTGIAIFALGTYCWLDQLRLNRRAVLYSSFVMPISFKVVELLRFPNAVHTAAWFPWILFAITKIFRSQSKKELSIYGALFSFFCISLLTGGYPYYIYYSAFLLLPYFFVFLVPRLRQNLIGIQEIKLKPVVITFFASMLPVTVLGLPYLLKIGQLLAQTTDRQGGNFTYSTEHVFNFEDTIGALIYPRASSREGWYFFGIIGLLLIILFFVNRQNPIRNSNGEEAPAAFFPKIGLWEKLYFLSFIAIISYISYGRESYLFRFLWDYLPGFASLRAWGRFNIILVPMLAWLLAISYGYFEYQLINASKEKKFNGIIIFTMLFAYACVGAGQYYFWVNQIGDPEWNTAAKTFSLFFRHSVTKAFVFPGLIAFLSLFLLFVISKTGIFRRVFTLNLLLLGMTLLAAVELNLGPYYWTLGLYPAHNRRPDMINLTEYHLRSFDVPRTIMPDSIPLQPNFSAGIVQNWYFNRYANFLKSAENEPTQRDLLLGVTENQRLFFSKSITHETISAFLEDADNFQDVGRISLYNGDMLVVEVSASQDGYLSFIDNWDPDWHVYVDNEEKPLELLFGTFKSVYVSSGSHSVVFKYLPLKPR